MKISQPDAADHSEAAQTAPKKLSPAAERALAEAEARRAAQADGERLHALPIEVNGRAGPEPTRYGDWENKGLASDF